MAAGVLAANPSWRGPYVIFGLMALVMLVMTLQRRRLRDVAFRPDHTHGVASGEARQPR